MRAGVNAPADFEAPDNLALDKNGNLYIAEDQDVASGDDIWVAIPSPGHPESALETVRFASLYDCVAEPTGIYFDESGTVLFVTVQHRGGPDRRDLGMIITAAKP